MNHPQYFEEIYQRYVQHLPEYLPDGMIDMNLSLLQKMHLLDTEGPVTPSPHALTHYFQVIETDEKITLLNEQFVIWIVPSQTEVENSTRANHLETF